MKKILLFLLLLVIALAVVTRFRYGGGDPYPDLSSTPLLGEADLEEFIAYPEPIGNVAVGKSGRVFFTVHPEARPRGNKLLEYIDGAAEPFPDGASQSQLFDTVLGVVIDPMDRLWTIDHGNHGMRTPRLLAFDIGSGELIHDQEFDTAIAPPGSYLQDLQVSADGRTVVIADTSFWRKKPALIVYNIATATARRVLEGHESVSAEPYVIRNHDVEMRFLGGLVVLRGGVDGIALGSDWLYYGAISGSGLYRLPLQDLVNSAVPDSQLAVQVERVATKPLSDGFSIDIAGNVYGTDVEHGLIFRVDTAGQLQTLLRSPRIRWPDGLSFGPDGWLYLSDSALAEVILQTDAHVESRAPYKIFRFRPGIEGIAGQ